MAANDLERLPVVADALSLRLVGIISRSDLVRCGLAFDDDQRERLRSLREWLLLRRQR